MVRHRTNVVIETNVAEHPAVVAWRSINPRGAVPDRIVVLKERLACDPDRMRAVYRLEGAAGAAPAVIAKRNWRHASFTERTVYQHVLPQMSFATLRYHGFVEESASEYCWLFVEDAGEQPYNPNDPEHRRAAATFFGEMHASAAMLPVSRRLPDRNAGHYLRYLVSARNELDDILHNCPMDRNDCEIIDRVARQLDELRSRWDDIQAFCSDMPCTLVHGDFKPKNLRVARRGGRLRLLPFDWEMAGWAVPAADLHALSGSDLDDYRRAVEPRWPTLSPHEVTRLAIVGRLFRNVAAISWEIKRFAPSTVTWWADKMRFYSCEIVEALDSAG
jgi:thiamine kinase-like enzyme